MAPSRWTKPSEQGSRIRNGLLIFTLSLLASSVAFAKGGNKATAFLESYPRDHCADNEQVLFACTLENAEMLSLCARVHEGFAQLRVGSLETPHTLTPINGDASAFDDTYQSWASGQEHSVAVCAQETCYRIETTSGSGINGPSNNYQRVHIESKVKSGGGRGCKPASARGELRAFRKRSLPVSDAQVQMVYEPINKPHHQGPTYVVALKWQSENGNSGIMNIDQRSYPCTAPTIDPNTRDITYMLCTDGVKGAEYRLERVTDKKRKRVFYRLGRRSLEDLTARRHRFKHRLGLYFRPPGTQAQ